jgi:hypothetical protein
MQGSAACLQFDCSPQDPVCDASGGLRAQWKRVTPEGRARLRLD